MSEFLTKLISVETQQKETRDRLASLEQRLAKLELSQNTSKPATSKPVPAAASKPAASENKTAAENSESADQKEKSATQLKKEAKRLEKDAKFKEKLEKQKVVAATAPPKEAKEKKDDKKDKEPTVVKYTSNTPLGEKKGMLFCTQIFCTQNVTFYIELFSKIQDTTCQLPDAYSPLYVEAAWYEWWEKAGYFKPEVAVILPAFVKLTQFNAIFHLFNLF
jgi:hypothetical protein